jgi:hypothetical protein
VPNWNYQMHRLQWSGPVEPSQTMRLVVLTTVWVSLWRIVGIVLVALALYSIVRFGYPSFGVPRLDRWLRIAPTTVAIMLAIALSLTAPETARADAFARAAGRAEAAAVTATEVRAGLRLDRPGAGRARGPACSRSVSRRTPRPTRRSPCRGATALATRAGC